MTQHKAKPRKRRKLAPRAPEHKNVKIVSRTVRRLLVEYEMSIQELDQRSGMATGYGTQVLSGHVRLTFHHVFKWLDAMGVHPSVFFIQLAEMLKPKHSLVEKQPPDQDELDELVSQVATEMLRRGGRIRLRPGKPLPAENGEPGQEAEAENKEGLDFTAAPDQNP